MPPAAIIDLIITVALRHGCNCVQEGIEYTPEAFAKKIGLSDKAIHKIKTDSRFERFYDGFCKLGRNA